MEDRVKAAIGGKISFICDGYRVVWEEEDGCDEEFGPEFWVECENGFSGRSWDVRPAQEKSIQEFKQKVMEEGIEVDGERFFLDPNHPIYDSYSDLVLISEEEFAGLSANIETIRGMVKKYIDYKERLHRETHQDSICISNLIYNRDLRPMIQKLNKLFCLNKQTFKDSMEHYFDRSLTNRIVNEMKNKVEWSEVEKEALGF